jgi:hypothetical protein
MHRGIDGAAFLVAKHHDHFGRVQVFHGILDAANGFIGGDIAGDAHYEEIAYTLIEGDLRRHARIGAREDHGEWFLARAGTGEAAFVLAVGRFALHEAPVAVVELLPGIGRSAIGTGTAWWLREQP